MKPIISFDDFAKLDLRVGTVVDCIDVDKSEKLLKLTVDFGEEGTKTIFSGIKQWYQPDELKDKQFVFVINLEPRKMMNEFSEGMLLAADPEFSRSNRDSIGADGEKPELLKATSEVPPGTTIL